MEARRVDLANWALRTSLKFATEVKYHHQGFSNHPSPPNWRSSSELSAQGQVLHCKHRYLGCSSAEGTGLPPQTQEQRLKLYQGLNRCSSFPLLSAPHSLFSICTDRKISEKIPGAPTWRWGERIWLTGPSGRHRNSPQGLNISSIRVFHQIRDPEIPITLRSLYETNEIYRSWN